MTCSPISITCSSCSGHIEGLQLERSQLSTPEDRHLAKLSLVSEEMCTDPRKSLKLPVAFHLPPHNPLLPLCERRKTMIRLLLTGLSDLCMLILTRR
jgi:hypothetical protein